MKIIITLARLASMYFCLIALGSFLWFIESLDALSFLYGIISSLAFIAAGFMPRELLKKQDIRLYLIILYALAIIITLPMIYADLNLINGADYPAVRIRIVEIAIFIIMILEVKMTGKTLMT